MRLLVSFLLSVLVAGAVWAQGVLDSLEREVTALARKVQDRKSVV